MEERRRRRWKRTRITDKMWHLVSLLLAIQCMLTAVIIYEFVHVNNVANAIQQSRLESCLALNARHTNTLAALSAELGQQQARAVPGLRSLFEDVGVHVSDAQARALGRFEADQAKTSLTSTKALIDALAPFHKNCAALIRR